MHGDREFVASVRQKGCSTWAGAWSHTHRSHTQAARLGCRHGLLAQGVDMATYMCCKHGCAHIRSCMRGCARNRLRTHGSLHSRLHTHRLHACMGRTHCSKRLFGKIMDFWNY